MPHTKRIEVRWRDLDAFRHVNNATYLTYLEEARDELLAAILGDAALLDGFVVVRVAIDYRSSIRQEDEEVDVTSRLVRIGRASVTTREQVRVVRDDRVAADAETVTVRYDEATDTSVPIEPELRSLLEASLEAGER
jgi:acyl-CoA thioester hydrolase